MRRKFSPIEIVIGILIAIGLFASRYFIPILVLGAIFLLYKFPPSRWKKPSMTRGSAKPKTKTAKFRVINGSKDSDKDDFPKYH